MWKFCGKAQFPHGFERFARKSAENVPFPQNFTTRKLVEIAVFYAVLNEIGSHSFTIITPWKNHWKISFDPNMTKQVESIYLLYKAKWTVQMSVFKN